jgi:hypothetical protein
MHSWKYDVCKGKIYFEHYWAKRSDNFLKFLQKFGGGKHWRATGVCLIKRIMKHFIVSSGYILNSIGNHRYRYLSYLIYSTILSFIVYNKLTAKRALVTIAELLILSRVGSRLSCPSSRKLQRRVMVPPPHPSPQLWGGGARCWCWEGSAALAWRSSTLYWDVCCVCGARPLTSPL